MASVVLIESISNTPFSICLLCVDVAYGPSMSVIGNIVNGVPFACEKCWIFRSVICWYIASLSCMEIVLLFPSSIIIELSGVDLFGLSKFRKSCE